MITRLTGVLNRVLDEEVRLQVGPVEYQVLVPEFVRRQVQTRLGHELTLHTTEYFEGNPMQGRVVPRLVGFLQEGELEFFELFCTVEKVGVRKALKALMRPVREIAEAIQRQDHKWLTSLPGIGAATAEHMVASLKRKVTRYTVLTPAGAADGDGAGQPAFPAAVDAAVLEDTYSSLLALGLTPMEARARLDKVLATGKRFESVQDLITEIYSKHGH
jgi:Holliday junction DNA helicase RuvA